MDRQKARERAEALVAQMTVEERASQLRFDAPAIERLGIPAYNWWNEALHGLARGGTATSFPQAIGMAAMFDDALLEQIAAAISTEARAKYNAVSKEGDRDIYHGLNMWSPNINLFRDPRWGRGHETYGEDPYLTSRLGKAFVKGLQGDGETLRADRDAFVQTAVKGAGTAAERRIVGLPVFIEGIVPDVDDGDLEQAFLRGSAEDAARDRAEHVGELCEYRYFHVYFYPASICGLGSRFRNLCSQRF